MDLRQLRNFVAVVEARSFTAASGDLGMSQPALSQSIARLERELGCVLLLRNKRLPGVGVVPTASGESLYEDALDILRRLEGARDRAIRAGDASRPTVLLGFTSSTPRELVDLATGSGDGDAASQDVVPVQLTWGQELRAVLAGGVDLALLQYPVDETYPGLSLHSLLLLQRVVVLPSAHRLAGRSAVTLADLAGEPILDPGEFDDAPQLHDYWLGMPRPAESPIGRIVGPPTKTVEEMCAFVRAGRGTAIAVSAVAEQYLRHDLVFIPVADLEATAVGIAIRSEDRRPHVRELYDRLVATATGSASQPRARAQTPSSPAAGLEAEPEADAAASG